MNNEKNINESSFVEGDIQYISNYVPKWIVRWGITTIFVSLAIFLSLCYFIKYPNIIYSRVTFTTEEPAVRLLSPINSKIKNIFVNEGGRVEMGSTLIELESNVDLKDINDLKVELNNFKLFFDNSDQNIQFHFKTKSKIGEINNEFNILHRSYLEYCLLIDKNKEYYIDDHFKKQSILIDGQLEKIDEQIKIQKKELSNKNNILESNNLLFDKGLITKVDLESYENELLAVESTIKNLESRKYDYKLEKLQNDKVYFDLSSSNSNKKIELYISILDAFKKIEYLIEQWEKQYLIKSPINGNATFTRFLSINQNVQYNEEIISIVPDSNRIIGKMLIPSNNFGKIKIGQLVNVKLDEYPFYDYGFLMCRITSLSLIPKDKLYIADVVLENGLISNNGKIIKFRPEMQGNSEIITEETNLLEKLFNNFTKLIHSENK